MDCLGPRSWFRMRFHKHVALAAIWPSHPWKAFQALPCQALASVAGGVSTEDHIPLHNKQLFHFLSDDININSTTIGFCSGRSPTGKSHKITTCDLRWRVSGCWPSVVQLMNPLEGEAFADSCMESGGPAAASMSHRPCIGITCRDGSWKLETSRNVSASFWGLQNDQNVIENRDIQNPCEPLACKSPKSGAKRRMPHQSAGWARCTAAESTELPGSGKGFKESSKESWPYLAWEAAKLSFLDVWPATT